jgi:hypothetical protein
LSQPTNLNLTDLAATTEADFVRIATDLASNLGRLADLRRCLRACMSKSVLMDKPRFARNVEASTATCGAAIATQGAGGLGLGVRLKFRIYHLKLCDFACRE